MRSRGTADGAHASYSRLVENNGLRSVLGGLRCSGKAGLLAIFLRLEEEGFV